MTRSAGEIRIKRVYEAPAPGDGFRVLVDRLWPRGLSRERAKVDLWLKDAAPSTELRRWFHRDMDNWAEFRRRYNAELAGNPAVDELLSLARDHGKKGAGGLTLLYGARDPDRNHAIVLREALMPRRRPGRKPQASAKHSGLSGSGRRDDRSTAL